jgi:hypothetical protein
LNDSGVGGDVVEELADVHGAGSMGIAPSSRLARRKRCSTMLDMRLASPRMRRMASSTASSDVSRPWRCRSA